MKVILAESFGMCFGVRDAIKLAMTEAENESLTIMGELVHNPVVLDRLRNAGLKIARSLDDSVETPRVMITAHGAASRTIAALQERGLAVIEASCPLVVHAHRQLHRLVEAGYFPVVIGNPNHVEVQGLVGDFDGYTVIENERDFDQLTGRNRLGVVSQTTQSIDYVRRLVQKLKARYPESDIRFVDTVCQPTKDRQIAARRLANACDVIVVVGGKGSNNTRQLAAACTSAGARVVQIEDATELQDDWFCGVETAGLTAGTSTPDDVIASVKCRLEEINVPALLAAA